MLRIGVTGHRFLAEIEKLESGIDDALARIELAFPGETWAVVSSLAEGADRLVVERVFNVRPDARLIVPLPLNIGEYVKDFETDESKEKFRRLIQHASEIILPPGLEMPSRSEGYLTAGKNMLERCDVLIAIWDGQGTQGQGGTGEIVGFARQRGLPVAWVHAGNRKPGTMEPTSLGAQQGKVRYEQFP